MERIPALDVMKGIAIILVVLGHHWFPYNTLIYSVHLPIFFLISGYLFNGTNSDIKTLVIKKSKAYLLPYLFTCVLLILLSIIGKTEYTFVEQTIAGLWGKSTMNVPYPNAFFANIPRIGAVWFLLALFWGELLLCLCLKIQSIAGQLLYVLLLFVLALISFRYIYLPFSIQSGMLSLMYLYVGHIFRNYQQELLNVFKKRKSVIVPILLIVWMLCVYMGGVNLAICKFGKCVPIGLLGSISGSLFILVCVNRLSCDLHVYKILSFIGRITLFILVFHHIDRIAIHLGERLLNIGFSHSFALFVLIYVVYPLYLYFVYLLVTCVPFLKKMFNL